MSPSKRVNKHAPAKKRAARQGEEENPRKGPGEEARTEQRGGEGGRAEAPPRGVRVDSRCTRRLRLGPGSSAIKTRPRILGSRAAVEGERTARHFHRLQGARWASVGRPSGPGKGNAAERVVWAARVRPATVGG